MKKTSRDVIILNLCNKKAQSYDVCLHRYGVLALFCHFRKFFAFLPHYWPQKLKFGKNIKKIPEHIILLHMCTINQDHMMYGSWDMKFNRQNFFVILGIFLPFYPPPPNTLKNENIKNEKKTKKQKNTGDIIILHKSTKTHDHLLYCSRDMARRI